MLVFWTCYCFTFQTWLYSLVGRRYQQWKMSPHNQYLSICCTPLIRYQEVTLQSQRSSYRVEQGVILHWVKQAVITDRVQPLAPNTGKPSEAAGQALLPLPRGAGVKDTPRASSLPGAGCSLLTLSEFHGKPISSVYSCQPLNISSGNAGEGRWNSLWFSWCCLKKEWSGSTPSNL